MYQLKLLIYFCSKKRNLVIFELVKNEFECMQFSQAKRQIIYSKSTIVDSHQSMFIHSKSGKSGRPVSHLSKRILRLNAVIQKKNPLIVIFFASVTNSSPPLIPASMSCKSDALFSGIRITRMDYDISPTISFKFKLGVFSNICLLTNSMVEYSITLNFCSFIKAQTVHIGGYYYPPC